MGWGQLLGGAAGFVLSGFNPAGALAGAALGGGLDEATGGGQTGAARKAAEIAAAGGDRAAQVQKEISDQQIALAREQFNREIELQQPFRQAGTNALAQMQSGAFAQPAAFVYNPNKYVASPGYQSSLEEGLRGVRNRFAAGGGTLSGAALKATEEYGRRKALQDYREFDATDYARALDAYNAATARESTGYNRLASLAGIGQTATGRVGTAGQTMTADTSGALGSYGTAAARNYGNQGYDAGNAYLAGERARQSSYGEIGKALGSGGFGSLQTGFNNMFGARQPASSTSRYMPSGGYDPYLPYGYDA